MPDPTKGPRRGPPLQAAPARPAARPRTAGGAQRGNARRKKAKRKRLASLVVFLIMGGLMFLTAYLLAGGFGKEEAVEPAPPPASEPAAEVVPPPVPAPTRTATPFDEAADPPLFNFENAIPQAYLDAMQLTDIGGGQQMETRAAVAFLAMSRAAAEDGLNLAPVSGYRSNAHQTSNYNASIQRYLDQGLSREKAVELTEGYYAIPGTSEHEAGLAIDIGFVEDSFAGTKEFTWLQQHCAEYGFILRYRDDTFETTRIHWEPWHYRYVGANHAEAMAEGGFKTLEAYTASLMG